MARGSMKPTGIQLSDAISEELKGLKNVPATKELHSALLEHYPHWTVPERRVKKFLKRHLSQHADPSGADDDATLASSVTTTAKAASAASSAGKRLVKFFSMGSGGGGGSKPTTITTTTMSSPGVTAAPALREASPAKPVTPTTPPTIAPRVGEPALSEPVVVDNRSAEGAYLSDDNDGKTNDCNCGGGRGGSTGACTVM